ncbi:hypothetical protein JD844_015881 [Phrynosoma platyrhinos]|uniref:RGS domain-containing protein n=1 Tax=Phrynosoma platyrhinos TaxID=52577 RepID=A0ABQ7SJM2_PHRPL|nr:hypothetical protein JD844_015881 [Phrynosoma platyrhinos]
MQLFQYGNDDMTFAETIKYNPDFGIFEVASDAPEQIENQLKKLLYEQKPRNPIYDVTRPTKPESPASKDPSPPPQAPPPPPYLNIDLNYAAMATVTQTKDWFTLAKQSEHMITTDSLTRPVSSSHVRFSFEPSKTSSSNLDFRTQEMLPTASSTILIYSHGHAELESKLKKKKIQTGIPLLQQERARRSIDEGHSVSVPDTPSQTMLRAYVGQNWDSVPQEQMSDNLDRYQELACFRTVDEFTLAYIQYIVKNSIAMITGMPPEVNPTDVNFNRVSRVLIYEIEDSYSFMEPLLEHPPLLEDDTVERGSEISTKSEKDNTETRAAWCISHKTYDIGNRHEFERFKNFIKGTLGERYWWLWVDIERLKALRDPKRQKRQLDRMKKTYLMSNGDYFLTSEVLQKLNLEDGDRWNLHNLRRIQSEVRGEISSPAALSKGAVVDMYSQRPPRLLSAILPRSQSAVQEDPDGFVDLADINRQRPGTACTNVTHLTVFPDKMDYLKPQLDRKYTYAEVIPGTTPPDISELGSSTMERMLQSLNTESRAGYVFTDFCEKSGNTLWKNSTYFWFDLQDYHQLFYQETLHPFKLCKQAQVELVEETRQLDSVYFRKLQALHEKSISKKSEILAAEEDKVPQRSDSTVAERPGQSLPEEIKSYNIAELLHKRLDLEQFRIFLEQQSASVDLMCWIDIEQFRRMLHKNKAQREEKSKEIKNKYLNKKYFFGPDSPATKEEQEQQVDNKWVFSSREIITFRKALLNPITACQFKRFVSLKGDLLENGVIFWQEVQKYKDMCHSHCDDAIIQNKITEIIRCFINSSIPPAIQIDIPEDQAQKIIEHRKELGPYVFREAQMTIFALLFKFWPKFCEFRSNLADENILPLLDKRREKKLEKMKRAKEVEEKAQGKKFGVSVKPGAATTVTSTGLESRRTSKSELSSTPSFTGFGRQLSWNYSKYLEALQQERVLLKIQEDLEKKAVTSSAYAGFSSIFTLKSDPPVLHPVPERPVYPTPFTSAFVKQQRTYPPKDNERIPKL